MGKPVAYYNNPAAAAKETNRDESVIRLAMKEDPSLVGSNGARVHKEKLAAWLTDFDWKKKDPPPEQPDAFDIERASREELKRRRELVALKRESLNLDIQRDSMLPVAEFEATLAKTISAFTTTLSQIPGRAAQKIVAKARMKVVDLLRRILGEEQFAAIEGKLDAEEIDYGDIVDIIEAEVEHARLALAQGEFISETAPSGTAQT